MSSAERRPGAWRRAAWWSVRAAFLIGLIVLLWRTVDFAAAVDAVGRVGVATFALALLIDVSFVMVESARILVLSRRQYAYGLIVRSRFLSIFIGNLLPGLAAGDVVRVFLMDRVRPGNKTGLLVLLFGNRLYGLVALVSLGLVALLQPSGAALLAQLGPWAYALVAGGLLLLAAPLVLHWPAARAISNWLVSRAPRAMAGLAKNAQNAALDLTSVRQWAFAIVTSSLTNFMVVLEFWIFSRAAGANVSLGEWCLFVPVVAIATLLPLGVGAIGTQEAALLLVSRLAHVPVEPLLAVSACIHVMRILGTLPGLLFYGDLVDTVRQLRRPSAKPVLAEPGA